MLLSSYGASRLGKAFQRSTTATVTDFEAISRPISYARTSTMTWFGKGPALSSSASSLKAPDTQRIWQPSHGIVFGLNPGAGASTPRALSTAIVADAQQELVSNSKIDRGFIHSASENHTVLTSNPSATNDTTEANQSALEPAEDSLLEDLEQDELPATTSSFKMSEEIFRGARNAAQGSPESFWCHTLYRGPEEDGVERKVKVHYCRSKHTSQRVLEHYFLDKKILGFDLEWKPDTHRNGGIKKNVSLVQLASEDRIALFHIALYPGDKVSDLVAPGLKAIMEDPSVTKVGVAIKADCTRLRKFLDINARGIFELSHLYKLVKFSSSKDYKLINKKLTSLATQVQDHLHLPMFKGAVRGSDWAQALAMDQIIYAASDSYAGIHLFDTLEIKRKALDPTPPRPYHAEENKPIRLAEGVEIPTDEELEPDEPEQKKYTKLTPSYLASAAEAIELDPEFDIQNSLSPGTSSPSRPRSTPKPPPRPKHPLVIAAESLSASYRESHPKNRAAPACLRCYFIWYHNPDLSLQDIAGILREVPLQITTVVNYILESIKLEKLPFEKERLSAVLGMLPKEVASGRYRTLAKACGELQEQ